VPTKEDALRIREICPSKNCLSRMTMAREILSEQVHFMLEKAAWTSTFALVIGHIMSQPF
jgi:hypothetical protein